MNSRASTRQRRRLCGKFCDHLPLPDSKPSLHPAPHAFRNCTRARPSRSSTEYKYNGSLDRLTGTMAAAASSSPILALSVALGLVSISRALVCPPLWPTSPADRALHLPQLRDLRHSRPRRPPRRSARSRFRTRRHTWRAPIRVSQALLYCLPLHARSLCLRLPPLSVPSSRALPGPAWLQALQVLARFRVRARVPAPVHQVFA